ncbi:unnamed protein product, partial [Phaeothamnion confervicola]
YVWGRLRTLSEDTSLGNYRWDSGGKFHYHDWHFDDGHTPTDAEVLMHVFVCVGDTWLAREAQFRGDRPFAKCHYFENPQSLTGPGAIALQGRIALVRVSPIRAPRPRFGVVVDGMGWPATPGKPNVFHAIALFLKAVENRKAGFLSYGVSLGDVLREVF